MPSPLFFNLDSFTEITMLWAQEHCQFFHLRAPNLSQGAPYEDLENLAAERALRKARSGA